MSEQTEQIKADVEALQTASSSAVSQIHAVTEYALSLEESDVTDEQFTNLHNALVGVTADLNKAVEDSQAALSSGR